MEDILQILSGEEDSSSPKRRASHERSHVFKTYSSHVSYNFSPFISDVFLWPHHQQWFFYMSEKRSHGPTAFQPLGMKEMNWISGKGSRLNTSRHYGNRDLVHELTATGKSATCSVILSDSYCSLFTLEKVKSEWKDHWPQVLNDTCISGPPPVFHFSVRFLMKF